MSKTKKKKMKTWIKVLLIIVSTLLLFGLIFGIMYFVAYSRYTSYKNTDPSYVTPTGDGLVFAANQSLYDKNGNILRLKGVNVGNLLVSEGWMAPYCTSYYVNKDGKINYPAMAEYNVRKALDNNTNLNESQIEELRDKFRSCWFSDSDFTNLKTYFKCNAIRLPFYWGDLMEYKNDDYTMKDENIAFEYLDYFIEKCADNNIYVILDLHAAPVTQNGYDHGGYNTNNTKDLLWFSEKGIKATETLWTAIADHYNKPENARLSQTIATYGILNEPSSSNGDTLINNRGTQSICFDTFNRLYNAIRKTGDQHIITINCIWTYWEFPDPDKYGWKNIQYEVHFYNSSWRTISWDSLYIGLEFTRFFHNFKIPYYVGEFNFYDSEENWLKYLAYFDRIGYSWTMWSYKKANTGNWDDSWGLYNVNLNLWDNNPKVNLSSATYNEISSLCDKLVTSKCNLSTSGRMLRNYLNK